MQGCFSMSSLALKWSYFFGVGSVIIFSEYSSLYMKQLGFSPSQIGLTSLFGIQHLCLPLFGYLGDKFRARKLVLIVSTVVLFITVVAPLLPLIVSLPTCFVKHSMNESMDLSKEYVQSAINNTSNSYLLPSNEESKRNNYVPWLSILFMFMVITKALFEVTERAFFFLQNVATITYLKEERASYGSYFLWAHIGGGISLFAIGLISSNLKLRVCGVLGDGYYITFVWAAVGIILSSFALPWFKYEYLEDRVINWTEVKTIVSDFHYIIVLIVAFYIGSCTGFQFNWEFWYISELSGSPAIMGVAGLIRRPLVALWFYASGYLIEKVGELKTIAASLFLFFVSFLAISFVNIPWVVLAIDLFQTAAYGISYTGLAVHFSKAGSLATSAIILGLLEMVYAMGIDAGSAVMGLLFYAIGSKATLFCYSLSTASVLVVFLAYIYFAKDLDEYEKLPVESDDEDNY